jgi:uncharacterized YigZ family protein
MKPFSFKTIESEAEGLYKEKGSKFYALAFPVENEEEVKERLDGLRKKYFDARHHCYAYRIGPNGEKVRANDDGEPNHSAGDPILGQIRSKEITNTLIVVVRYFGGVKLGVGGLIAAYRAAAESALSNATILEKDLTNRITLKFDYPATPEVMKMVNDFSMIILKQSLVDDCTIELEYRTKVESDILERVKLLSALGKIQSA